MISSRTSRVVPPRIASTRERIASTSEAPSARAPAGASPTNARNTKATKARRESWLRSAGRVMEPDTLAARREPGTCAAPRLLPEVLHGVPERTARDLDRALERPVQFEDEEHRGGHRERGDEEHSHDRRVAWREQAEARERGREPADHHQQERRGHRALRAAQDPPARLDDVLGEIGRAS